MSLEYQKIIKGTPLKTIVRIKPPTNFQREDVKLTGNTISLTDANNRIIEEHDCSEVYGPETDLSTIFQNSLKGFVSTFILGFNCCFFSFGSTGAGKSQTIEGNRKESGLIMHMGNSLFNQLDTRKRQSNQQRQAGLQNYSYAVRVRFVEILDEEIADLLGKGTQFTEVLRVDETIWEGPIISNSTCVTIQTSEQLNEILLNSTKRRDQTSNEFGKLSSKATAIFIMELIQTSEIVTDDGQVENLVMVSKMIFIDLPGSEIMLDDPEAIRVRQGSTLNKSIITFTTLIRDIANQQQKNDHGYYLYENSIVTHLMKDAIAGNCLSVGIFCIQHGDPKGSSYTLNLLKKAEYISNFPIVNESKAIGLLKKYRAECMAAQSNNRGNNAGLVGIDGDMGNYKMQEYEKKLMESHLDKLKLEEDRQRYAQKLTEIREKYNQLVKDKGDLQGELIKCEEEKLEISKALVELQIENTKLMEIIQTEKYESNTKLLNADGELLDLKIRDEKNLEKISQLFDEKKLLEDDKRELEIEFVALKKNFIEINKLYEDSKAKNQNVGMELINMVNENKALHDEINTIYKKSSLTTEENAKFIHKIEKFERENQEQREALVFAKSEIERLKTEMLRYDIMEQQHRLDIDNKKIEMEKGYIEITKDKQNEYQKLTKENEISLKRNNDEKLFWESQKMELTHKNKLFQRKIQELEDRLQELLKYNDEITAENSKMQLQLDEMRSIYRSKLLQFTNDQGRNQQDKSQSVRIGYDMNAREELIRSYNEKETSLTQALEKEKKVSKNLRIEIKALKKFSLQLKYLAEDWAPVGVEYPEILKRNPPTQLDDENTPALVVIFFYFLLFYFCFKSDQNVEIERLRKRNRRLEEELKIVQDQLLNQANKKAEKDIDIQQRLINEIEYIKSSNVRPGSSSQNNEILRRERNDLFEENKRLVNMLKDNKKWDIYMLQKENERLVKSIKQYEDGQSIAPISGDPGMMKTKLMYYEKMIKSIEKDKSQLLVRATMAEEQLKQLQEHLQKSTLEYQKKIMELKKVLQLLLFQIILYLGEK
ncbi:kinesin-like protein, putative [Ichthyophthirius multifiliis]|uniref:Kinesin-like protein, putative n=1 Tax=Ichthyophthirius multifiliis TaxID=5932 RepID=G0R4P9_ICHMU|nr:kinesin-like protein, putative [Ichthyophthirius multifiliis]EGR27555.1 kinesin-like protein, putative [Ichthyophthirius multifiliis]|eukprot:XP_004025007.1 kinesin-like protein, putative [Ichthyophthirius multifiliis]